jgi:C1q domain
MASILQFDQWQNSTGSAVGITLDSAGRVNMPNQPAFYAVKTATFGGAPGVITSYDIVYVNVGNSFNPSTGRFTAPVAGTYQFSFYRLGYAGNGHTDDYLRKNGALLSGYWLRSYYPSGEGGVNQMVAYMTLAINDYVDFYVPSNQTIYSDPNGWIRFGGHLVG